MRCRNWRHRGTVDLSRHLKVHDYLGKENHACPQRPEHQNHTSMGQSIDMNN
jgi:hypothetical protein